jgi:hypothetical protein
MTRWPNNSRKKAATCAASHSRMLGSLAEADDAVQEAWLRLSRSGGSGVELCRQV